jgi:cell division protein FtsI (penicillin-binding protein 3)
MRPANVSGIRSGPLWYWLVERIWRVEHAFERAKARRTDQDTPVRIFFVGALFAAGFVTLSIGAATKVLLADHDRSRGAYAAEPRADLTDRNGRLLAVDMVHYDLYLNRKEIFDTSETLRKLGAVLPEAAPRIPAALAANRRTILVSGLTPEQAQHIRDLGLPGVTFEPDERRLYPMGAVAAHLIGSSEKQGGRGLSGAERALDKLIVEEGALGKQVPLSIDVRVQAVVEEELHKAVTDLHALGGVGIVVDVHTGEILALASDPDFDPNQMGASSYNAQYNRAVAGRYELGSVMKMFTIAMGLDSHTVTLDTLFDCAHPYQIGTRTIHDLHSAGRSLTTAEVFTHSSNVGAARLGALAGRDTFLRYFKAFGLFHAADVGLVESARPQLPQRWTDSDLASIAFGHGIALSPLALSAAAISLFNGGEVIPLSIRKIDPKDAPHGVRVISPQTSRLMLDLMRRNVIEGTGKRADAPGLSVGGKTGTGEKPENGGIARHKVLATFASVFPTQGPIDAKRYFVLISIDEPDPALGPVTAVTTAAPVSGRVIDRIAPFLGVQRRPPEPLQQPIAGPPVEELGGGTDQ